MIYIYFIEVTSIKHSSGAIKYKTEQNEGEQCHGTGTGRWVTSIISITMIGNDEWSQYSVWKMSIKQECSNTGCELKLVSKALLIIGNEKLENSVSSLGQWLKHKHHSGRCDSLSSRQPSAVEDWICQVIAYGLIQGSKFWGWGSMPGYYQKDVERKCQEKVKIEKRWKYGNKRSGSYGWIGTGAYRQLELKWRWVKEGGYCKPGGRK